MIALVVVVVATMVVAAAVVAAVVAATAAAPSQHNLSKINDHFQNQKERPIPQMEAKPILSTRPQASKRFKVEIF